MTKKYIGTEYTIVLDASFDLYQAGEDNDDEACEEFADAYREQAEAIAEENGIDITVIDGSYTGPAMQRQSNNGDESELWQDIHSFVFGGQKLILPPRAGFPKP